MYPTGFLPLLGAVALLLWSTRLVKTGVVRAFGDDLRSMLAKAASHSASAAGLGLAVALALQSATATALLLTSLASRGFIALAPALAVMLGADLGSSLVVKVLSFDLKAVVPVLLSLSVAAFMLSDSARVRQFGRIGIGLSLIILSLGMIVAATAGWRGGGILDVVLSRLDDEPVMALVLAAGLTWLMHSSVAFVLLVLALSASGVVTIQLGLYLVLGANIGSGLIALALVWRESAISRRIVLGNLGFRLAGAVLALASLPLWKPLLGELGWPPAQSLAITHVGFNVALVALFLPVVGFAAPLLQGLALVDAKAQPGHSIRHLDEALLTTPHLALGAASREVLRLAERVEIMLGETMLTFNEADGVRLGAIRKLDDEVDDFQDAIKLYLTRLTRQPLQEADARRAFDLILFTTNLEHVGDIIDKSLLELAAKRRRNGVCFSPEGWRELNEFHARVVKQLKLAITVFMTNDPEMARELVREKDQIRSAERVAMESHLARLRDGAVASIKTSALHLDILRDLKRINAHLVSVAHPILEAAGELRGSRLTSPAE
jgi:phosphate:Na+ symporter